MELKPYQTTSLTSLEKFFRSARVDGVASAFETHADPDPKFGSAPAYRGLRDSQGIELGTLVDVPYVAIRIPTGGGKTLMAAHFIKVAADHYLERDRPLVLWLVPSRTIKQQTLQALKNPRHPYRRELDSAFAAQVAVFDSEDIDQITPQGLVNRMCIVVATLATARVEDTDIRDFYAHKEALEPHFNGLPSNLPAMQLVEGSYQIRFSFANLLKLHRPLVITDEAHNARSKLSGVLYERLAPSAIIEMTATPDMATSNVLVRVSASQLFAEEMIKLPVLLEEHLDGWDVALRHALLRRQELEEVAQKETDYVRPILLIQAEHAGGEATVQVIYDHLVSDDGERIDPDWVKIATGSQRELDDLDLFDRTCPVRIIITMEALKEGWDCSFAYVLCSVAGTKSATSIEQLLGRVLRMPNAATREQEALNKAYAHVVSPYFGAKAVEFTNHLENMGFSRLEAAIGIPVQAALLDGDEEHPALRAEVIKFTTTKKPDLASVPAVDLANIDVKAGKIEGEFEVTVKGAVDDATVDAIVKVSAKKDSDKVRTSLEQHNARARLRFTPAQKGEKFEIPQLSIRFGERVIPLANDLLIEEGFWNPASAAGVLDRLTFDSRTQSWELNLGAASIRMKMVEEPSVTYLAGLSGDWDENDLVLWLDGKVRQLDVKQEVMVAWVSQAIAPLKHKGYSLGQLVRGRFIIARNLLQLLDVARFKRAADCYQRVFDLATVVVDPAVSFHFPPLAYPMRSPCPAPIEWTKHFYAVPGDLPYLRADKTPAEEYLCALEIERCPDVDVWVRNLAHPTQFRLPTPTGFTYPDFVAKLKDGRIFVIEYKGEQLKSNDDSRAKAAIGHLWARKNPNGLYLMAVLKDEQGLGVGQQIAAAISAKHP